MSDLYDELSVDKGASADDIKKAHRRMVKKNHPDQGGDREAFERTQHAYLVLSDPDARDRYDRSGDDGKTSRSRDEAELMTRVFAIVNAFISGEQNLDYEDLPAAMMKHLGMLQARLREELSVPTRQQARARKALKKLTRKKKAPTNAGLLISTIETIIKERQREIDEAQRNLDIHLQVEAIISAYDYQVDPKPSAPPERDDIYGRLDRFNSNMPPNFFRSSR